MSLRNKKLIEACIREAENLNMSIEGVTLKKQRLSVIASYFNTVPFDELKSKQLKKCRDELQFYPANASQIPEFKGMTTKEICRINREKGNNRYPTISPATFMGYFSCISYMMSFLRSEGIIDYDPLKDIKFARVPLIKQNERNRAFEPDEWNKIHDYIVSNYTESDGFKYWIVFLLKYTGARLNELLQLVDSDFVTVDGVVCMMIYPDEFKTRRSGRLIPLHPELIKLGLVEFTQGKKGKLFPESEQAGRPLSYKTSKWSSYWRKKLGLGKGKNLISFRHSFIDDLKKAGVDLEKMAQLAGHSINTTADVYSKDYPMDVMFDVVSLIK
ncbi:Integrase [Vibrio parahaemolyticus]|uniref:tyrosine-type recombinase/integrase n=1 Tax=Vibrio parahaemolyticus TaxID=670 RepID=UPI0008FC5BDF|nr:tyrosine-type recombinase/integrase [Vibrio parahaemolyticus]APC86458.1 Integrase [Vibrio parahaemolyticus]